MTEHYNQVRMVNTMTAAASEQLTTNRRAFWGFELQQKTGIIPAGASTTALHTMNERSGVEMESAPSGKNKTTSMLN
jgi:hypothetical protein